MTFSVFERSLRSAVLPAAALWQEENAAAKLTQTDGVQGQQAAGLRNEKMIPLRARRDRRQGAASIATS